jgi:hypothetical protein
MLQQRESSTPELERFELSSSNDVPLPRQSIQVRKRARSEGIIFIFEWHALEYPRGPPAAPAPRESPLPALLGHVGRDQHPCSGRGRVDEA